MTSSSVAREDGAEKKEVMAPASWARLLEPAEATRSMRLHEEGPLRQAYEEALGQDALPTSFKALGKLVCPAGQDWTPLTFWSLVFPQIDGGNFRWWTLINAAVRDLKAQEMLRLTWDPPWDEQVPELMDPPLQLHVTCLHSLIRIRANGLLPSVPTPDKAGIGKREAVLYTATERRHFVKQYGQPVAIYDDPAQSDKLLVAILGIAGTPVSKKKSGVKDKKWPQTLFRPGCYRPVTLEIVCVQGSSSGWPFHSSSSQSSEKQPRAGPPESVRARRWERQVEWMRHLKVAVWDQKSRRPEHAGPSGPPRCRRPRRTSAMKTQQRKLKKWQKFLRRKNREKAAGRDVQKAPTDLHMD